MTDFINLLSNREISIIIWFVLFFGGLIINSKGSFKKLLSVIKILFSKFFIPFYIIFGIYLFSIISFLKRENIWEFFLYKDFIYWFLTTGIVLFFKANKLEKHSDFLKVILTTISATIILEFIINFYNFSLFWELILVPILTFISVLAYYAELKSEDISNKTVADFLKNILSVIGFGIMTYVAYKLINNYDELLTLDNSKSFLLAPIFTLLFIPLIYLTVLYMKYEKVFNNLNRYKFLTENKKTKIKYLILKYANINFNRIEKAHYIVLFNKKELQNENDIKNYIKKSIKS